MQSQPPPQEQVDAIARAALERFDLSEGATAALVNVSENSTYRVDDPESGFRAALRVSRRGYHSGEEIASELAWIDALRDDGVVETPHVVPGRDGRRVQRVATEALPEHHVVLFEWLDGEAP